MKRPLRSVMLCNHAYLSVYVCGVAQAMGQLGHWHREVSVLDDLDRIARQLDEMRPDVIWTHTVPWVPKAAPAPGWVLVDLLATWKAKGTRVVLHDGDPRTVTRFPRDLSAAFDVALCNHSLPRHEWRIPAKRWPYAAMWQREMAVPVEALRCHLLFAGIVRQDDGLYSFRSEVLGYLREMMLHRLTVRTASVNDRMQAADVAASAEGVLGFGRPEVPGWTDTRVFQYPGAGGILLHDDASEFLTPGEHYLPFERVGDAMATANEICRAGWALGKCEDMRERAFRHVQAHHTWRHRVEDALSHLGLS